MWGTLGRPCEGVARGLETGMDAHNLGASIATDSDPVCLQFL